MSSGASSIYAEDYPDLAAHLSAIVERYTGLPCIEWMDFDTDFGCDDVIKTEIVLDCFEAFCPDFTPGEGDMALAMKSETVNELISYFEAVADELPSGKRKNGFRFHFGS